MRLKGKEKGRVRSAEGARGERNETPARFVFHIHQRNAKIMIGQNSKQINDNSKCYRCEYAEILWRNWIAAHATKKMAPVLKITVVLVICFISVECRKDKVFCVIFEKGLKANRSLIHTFIISLSSLWSMSSDMSGLDGVLCNSCKIALLK